MREAKRGSLGVKDMVVLRRRRTVTWPLMAALPFVMVIHVTA